MESVKTYAMQSVVRRLVAGVGSSALHQLILALQAIALVPFFLRAWGADGYGRWLVLTALVSHISLLELGGQNYFGNMLAIGHARDDTEAFRKRLSEGVSLFLSIGVIGFLVLVGCLFLFLFFPIPGLGRSLEQWEAWVLVLLGTLFVLLAIPSGIYCTAYRACGLFARAAMIGNVIRGFGIAVSMMLLYLKVRPEVYALSMLVMGVLLTIMIVWDSRRSIPACRGLRISLVEARKGWAHLGGALSFWFITLAQTAIQQGVLLILAVVATPTVVVIYVTHRAFTNISGYIRVLLQGPLLPEMSFLWAQNRFTDLSRTTFFTMKATLLATGFFSILLWVSAPILYPLWTEQNLQIHFTLLVILLTQGVLASGWSISTWGLLATNNHHSIAKWSLANASITIILAIWLGQSYGAVGVAFSGLIGDFVCGVVVFPFLASSFLKVPAREVFVQIGSAIMMIFPFMGIALFSQIFFEGWWPIFMFLFLSVGVIFLIIQLAIRQPGTKKELERIKAGWNLGVR